MAKIDLTPIKGLHSYYGRKVTSEAVEAARRMKGVMVSDLKSETPVDTGKARDGWKTYNVPGGFHIINDVEYIHDLNDGYSEQAAPNFIERTLMKYGRIRGPVSTSNDDEN